MASIHDVAAYVVNHFDRPISTMKLQKLVYFGQGWSLGLFDRPLVPNEFQAWARGPVAYELFDYHRREFAVEQWPLGNSAGLDPDERMIMDAVLSNYGALSGAELSELTHRPGTPWAQARLRAGVAANARAQEPLDLEEIREYFRNQFARQAAL